MDQIWAKAATDPRNPLAWQPRIENNGFVPLDAYVLMKKSLNENYFVCIIFGLPIVPSTGAPTIPWYTFM